MIPSRGNEVGVTNTRKLTLWAEWYSDFFPYIGWIFVPSLLFARETKIEREIPGTIETKPLVTLELWFWMFWPRL